MSCSTCLFGNAAVTTLTAFASKSALQGATEPGKLSSFWRQTRIGLQSFGLGIERPTFKGRQRIKAIAMEQESESKGTRPVVLDSHLHVWASEQEAEAFPYGGPKPKVAGSTDLLLQAMDEAGVDGALIVQPFDHKFDHSYVSRALQQHPNKFVGCLLADPTPGGGGAQELERLVREDGYSAVRFNPYLWPDGEKMTNEVGRAMYARAGQLGTPVGFMCFKGLHLHIDDIETLCREFPETKVMLDHFAFTNPRRSELEVAMWTRLLALADHPQVYVKLSAFFRVSQEEYPYKDTWPMIRQLADTFGAKRLFWGSDFPYVTQHCGYPNNWKILDGTDVLTEEESALVRGEALAALFPGKWGR